MVESGGAMVVSPCLKRRNIKAHLMDDVDERLSDFSTEVVRQTGFVPLFDDFLHMRDD